LPESGASSLSAAQGTTQRLSGGVVQPMNNPAVSSSCPYHVINPGSGPVISTPRFRAYFLGAWDTDAQNDAQNALNTIATSPAFYNRLLEYNIGQGSVGPTAASWTGSWATDQLPTAQFGNCLANGGTGDVNGFIADIVDDDSLYAPSPVPASNDILVVFLSPNMCDVSDCSSPGQCAQPSQRTGPYGGYHYETNKGRIYAVVEWKYGPENVETMTHEMAEAMTDPYPCSNPAWLDSSTYEEICDLCPKSPTMSNGNPIAHDIRGLPVWRTWSQEACRCVTKRDVTLGDVTGNGVPTEILERTNVADLSMIWYPYSVNVPNWQWGGDRLVPFLLDTTGAGITRYMLFDPWNAVMYSLDIQLGMWSTSGPDGVCCQGIPAPGDYDGDGVGDVAVFDPVTDQSLTLGQWYITDSSTGQVTTQQWGTVGDWALPGDYDSDGITDFAVYRPSAETWYILPSSQPGTYWWWSWDLGSNDFPIPGDFDGDGQVDVAYWRMSAGAFHVATSSSQFQQTYWYSIGSPYDWPVVKDWDADWQSDFAVWHPADGTWHITYSRTGDTQVIQWGNGATDMPVDWFVPEYPFYPYAPQVRPYSQYQPTAPPSTPWSPSTLWSTGLASALTALGFSRLRRRRAARPTVS
jgi:hypothetical protein